MSLITKLPAAIRSVYDNEHITKVKVITRNGRKTYKVYLLDGGGESWKYNPTTKEWEYEVFYA